MISTYDFEAIQVKRGEKLRGRDILYKHIPATFSVHSNVPGHTEAQHRQSTGNPQRLVDELVSILHLQQVSVSQIMHRKFETIFHELDRDIQELTEELESIGSK